MGIAQRQFVIQEHKTEGGVHWDLMLEADGYLETYRLDRPPCDVLTCPVNAEKIFDHPIKFLEYEGPVQNGKGRVLIVDKGTFWATTKQENITRLFFEGDILRGKFDLTLTKAPVWCLTFNKQ